MKLVGEGFADLEVADELDHENDLRMFADGVVYLDKKGRKKLRKHLKALDKKKGAG